MFLVDLFFFLVFHTQFLCNPFSTLFGEGGWGACFRLSWTDHQVAKGLTGTERQKAVWMWRRNRWKLRTSHLVVALVFLPVALVDRFRFGLIDVGVLSLLGDLWHGGQSLHSSFRALESVSMTHELWSGKKRLLLSDSPCVPSKGLIRPLFSARAGSSRRRRRRRRRRLASPSVEGSIPRSCGLMSRDCEALLWGSWKSYFLVVLPSGVIHVHVKCTRSRALFAAKELTCGSRCLWN